MPLPYMGEELADQNSTNNCGAMAKNAAHPPSADMWLGTTAKTQALRGKCGHTTRERVPGRLAMQVWPTRRGMPIKHDPLALSMHHTGQAPPSRAWTQLRCRAGGPGGKYSKRIALDSGGRHQGQALATYRADCHETPAQTGSVRIDRFCPVGRDAKLGMNEPTTHGPTTPAQLLRNVFLHLYEIDQTSSANAIDAARWPTYTNAQTIMFSKGIDSKLAEGFYPSSETHHT